MKTEEIRKKTVDQLNTELENLYKESFNLRFQKSSGQLENTSRVSKVRKLIANDFIEVFSDCDLLLTPTAPSAAFPLNEKQDDPIKMYLNDVFTVPASLAGIPGISIPYGHDKDGLPLGIQLLGKHYNEQEIFNAAFALEKDYE